MGAYINKDLKGLIITLAAVIGFGDVLVKAGRLHQEDEDAAKLMIDDFSNPCPFCELEGKEVRKCGRRRALIRCGVVGNTEGECPYKGA